VLLFPIYINPYSVLSAIISQMFHSHDIFLTCGRHDSASALKTNDNRSASHQSCRRDVPRFFGYEIKRPTLVLYISYQPTATKNKIISLPRTIRELRTVDTTTYTLSLFVCYRFRLEARHLHAIFRHVKELLHMKCQLPTNYGIPD